MRWRGSPRLAREHRSGGHRSLGPTRSPLARLRRLSLGLLRYRARLLCCRPRRQTTKLARSWHQVWPRSNCGSHCFWHRICCKRDGSPHPASAAASAIRATVVDIEVPDGLPGRAFDLKEFAVRALCRRFFGCNEPRQGHGNQYGSAHCYLLRGRCSVGDRRRLLALFLSRSSSTSSRRREISLEIRRASSLVSLVSESATAPSGWP
jgi:hypothetical protein